MVKHFTQGAVRWSRSCSCWGKSWGQCRCTHSSPCPDSCLQPHRPVTSQDSHPCPTLQLPHVQQENLRYLSHGSFIPAATPRTISREAALRACHSSLPLSGGHDTCLSALTDLAVSLSETVYLTSFHFSCKVYLWKEVGVTLKKDLGCTTGSGVPMSG